MNAKPLLLLLPPLALAFAEAWHWAGHGASLVVLVALAVLYAQNRRHRRAERVLAEQAAEAARAAELKAFHEHPLPKVWIDPSLPIEGAVFGRVNPAAAARWGYDADTLTSRPYETFIAGSASDTHAAAAEADRGGNITGFLNAYVAGPLHPTPGVLVYNWWIQLTSGYWLAVPWDEAAHALSAASDARDTLSKIGREAISRLAAPHA